MDMHPLCHDLAPRQLGVPRQLLSTAQADMCIKERSPFAWVLCFRLGIAAAHVDVFGSNAPWERPRAQSVRLAEWGFIAVKDPREGDVVVYGDFAHCGLVTASGLIESRVGGTVFRHALEDIPAPRRALFLRRVDPRTPARVQEVLQ